MHVKFTSRVIATFIFTMVMRQKEHILLDPSNIWVLCNQLVIFKVWIKSVSVLMVNSKKGVKVE